MFHTVGEESKAPVFSNCWTAGDDLSHPLGTFDVTLRPGKEAGSST